jgi:hypothetical protein
MLRTLLRRLGNLLSNDSADAITDRGPAHGQSSLTGRNGNAANRTDAENVIIFVLRYGRF